MANEARVQTSLQIVNGNLKRTGQASVFNADVTGAKGPVPGAFTASTSGTDVDLSELTTPGFCVITNLDATNYVEYGTYDVANSKFHPLGEIGAGEAYLIKFSRNLFEEYTGAGTGTTADINRLRIKANTASCNVVVEAYEK